METVSSAPSLELAALFDTIHSKLTNYEREYRLLNDISFIVELALWKFKVDEFMIAQAQHDGQDTADMRGQCRINCGAEVVILNVLPFLIAN